MSTGNMRQLVVDRRICCCSQFMIFLLELLGQAIGCLAGPSSSNRKIMNWEQQQILLSTHNCPLYLCMALVPWYIISQNHFSKFGCLCFVYIHLQWWAGPMAGPYTLEQPTQPQCWVLVSQHQFTENMKRIFQGNSSIYY